MNTRLLFFISLCVAMLAAWFYRSQDGIEAPMPISASNIEFEATDIDAVQTNKQGLISYLLTAEKAVHFTDSNQDQLTNLRIDWQPSAMRRIQLTAQQGILDQAVGEFKMTQNVVFMSTPADANTNVYTTSPVTTQLQAEEIIGNFNTNLIHSDKPVKVLQGQNSFESARFQGDLNTGEYQFDQVAVVFEPPKRQDIPVF